MKSVAYFGMRSVLMGVLLAFGIGTASAGGMDYGDKGNIVQVAAKAGQFETLVAALKAAGLDATLEGEGPYTVFAPTDAAFGKLPDGTAETLLKPENQEKLKSVLLYHVVSGRVPAETAMTLDSAKTVQGGEVRISTMDGKVMVNDATVVAADVEASNGVIHVIDTVLIPD